MSQRGLLLRADDHHVAEVDVPVPPQDFNAVAPRAYATLLPGAGALAAAQLASSCEVAPTWAPPLADPEHLLLADVPFSWAVGRPLALVYDSSGRGLANAAARRLTASLGKEHLGVQVGPGAGCITQPGPSSQHAPAHHGPQQLAPATAPADPSAQLTA